MSALITIDGATARLSGVPAPAGILRECLSWLHPGRFFNQGFKQGRWDGRVCLADGNRFPAGFTARVRRHLVLQGIKTRVSARGASAVDSSFLTPDYLHGITLRDYQLEAVRTMLSKPRGALKEPTGSGKTAMIAAAARLFWEEKGWRTLVVVPKKGLAGQTRKALMRFYDGEVKVGIAGDGHRVSGAIVVGTAQTLAHFEPRTIKERGKRARKVPPDPWLTDLIAKTDVLILDECHRAKSDQWQRIAQACPAVRRYGLSGTPLQEVEFNDIKLEGQTGPLVHETRASSLIERRLSARPKILMVAATNASQRVQQVVNTDSRGRTSLRDPDYRQVYNAAIVESERHNRSVLACIKWLHDRKRRILVLCRLKAHFIRLAEGLQDLGVEAACLWGNTQTEERDEAKAAFAAGEIRCILATTIFDEGEDVRGIDAIVLAEGVSVNTSALQRIGRGMRPDSDDVWVVDFAPLGSKVLTEHAAKRAEIYEGEGYEVEVLEDWPARLNPDKPPANLLPFETWS